MKHKRWTGWAVMVLIISAAVPSWSQTSGPATIASIDVKTLQEMTRTQKVTLINVSGLLVCMDARIPGSLCLSCDDEKDGSVLSSLAKESKIVFYAGRATPDAECDLVKKTIAQGFTSAYALSGGLSGWRQAGLPVASEKRIPRVISRAVNPKRFAEWQKQAKNPLVIDIRSARAYAAGHLDGARNFPMPRLHLQYVDIPLDRTLLIVDEDGTESFLASSYLARKGFLNIQRLKGGMANYRRGTR
jgi:rhodanese-related sulfurtransferase